MRGWVSVLTMAQLAIRVIQVSGCVIGGKGGVHVTEVAVMSAAKWRFVTVYGTKKLFHIF
jgi:hypothetical protein